MCIISGPVKNVSSTKILAFPSKNLKRQLTVYRNSVDSPNSNMMCLPVPNPSSVKFEFVPKDIFKQCENSFAKYEPFGMKSMSARNFMSQSSKLPVLSHGSYNVVLVPSLEDFDKVPDDFMILTQDVIQFLKNSYPTTFGVLLCKLKKGMTDYEPFAYSHNLLSNKNLFYPTKHFHTKNNFSNNYHNLLEDNYYPFNNYSNQSINHDIADDWDHEIYSICTSEKCHTSDDKILTNNNVIEWNKLPLDFQLSSQIPLRCAEIRGTKKNLDVCLPLVL